MTSVCTGKCGAGSSARGQVGAGVGGLQGHSLLLSKQAPEPMERMPGRLCEVCDFSGSGKTRRAGWVVFSPRCVQLVEKTDGWGLARCVPPRMRGRGV